jgi:4-amino-4-deoxy-L-arabinose transferase-like glycosyltransferase
MQWWRNQVTVLAVLAALSLALRFFSFFPSVINHDESTYIVIAEGLLKGKVYFDEYIDTKPIGIFLLFAAFLKMLPSVFAIRLITALWVALTAWLLYKLKIRLGASHQTAMASGVLYLFLCSIFTFYGVAPNTELYYTLFTTAAVLLAVQPVRHPGFAVLSGLSLGMAFMMKYVVLFDALAIGLFLLVQQVRHKEGWLSFWWRALLMAITMVIPFLLTWAWYQARGLNDTFLFHTFEVMKRYPVSRTPLDYLKFFADFLLRFLPITLAFIMALRDKRSNPTIKLLAILWMTLTLIPVMITGRLFGHYFIQLMPAFALLAGEYFRADRTRFVYPLLGILLAANMWIQKKDYYDKPDYPRQIATWLQQQLQPKDIIYTGNYHHILYHLLGMDSPTPYVHRSLLWQDHHIQALGIRTTEAWDNLWTQQPVFILFEGKLPDNAFSRKLIANYRPVRRFGKDIIVYRRLD